MSRRIMLTGTLLAIAIMVHAQGGSGETGITNATQEVRRYFTVGVDLVYAIGAIIGLVGAVKVYNKWTNGEPDTAKVASAWFGACIFLVVVATVLRGFFGG
ncbi:DUF4134 domain-containing protein [Sphingobacterium phlebotomi]|uniref:DUF4134 domain-containing protein n=2 Tax=Sphingobacterium phlebotomi TaxID=2605433 RepID=A0A5D4H974_9SPHI|nr:DUF4134 domain-containing protein [Sphingobacterium phlebotomi]TYR37416.1 DUF4134 domain-containing protein [Sphingobacterium phlebotomi]